VTVSKREPALPSFCRLAVVSRHSHRAYTQSRNALPTLVFAASSAPVRGQPFSLTSAQPADYRHIYCCGVTSTK
jgi:hypothetical protein